MRNLQRRRRSSGRSRPLVLAVASGGGHFQELLLLAPAFEETDVVYACTDLRQGSETGTKVEFGLRDYSRDQPLGVLVGVWETARLVMRVRPDWVVSTGAAPGLLTLFWGRMLGADTIWIDSVASSERLSLSGRIASWFSHVTVTQWEHLSRPGGPSYWGRVI